VGFFFEGLEFSILELGLFWAGSYEELGGLLVVVGPGGQISTVDRSRVLNVNRSLCGSTSRGRAQRDVLRAQRARLVRGLDLYYRRGSCLHLIIVNANLNGRHVFPTFFLMMRHKKCTK